MIDCVWGKNASAGRPDPAAWLAWRQPYKPLVAPRAELARGEWLQVAMVREPMARFVSGYLEVLRFATPAPRARP